MNLRENKEKINPDHVAAYTQIQNIRKEIHNEGSDAHALLEMLVNAVKFCEEHKLFEGADGTTLEIAIKFAYDELSEKTGVSMSWRR